MTWRRDIRLDENWHLTQAADGDAPIVSEYDSLLQEIRLEAVTQEGELFFDTAWGWSLLDFLQSQDDELTRLEVQERIKSKLRQRPEVDFDSVQIELTAFQDAFRILTSFRFMGEDELRTIDVQLDRVKVEVVASD